MIFEAIAILFLPIIVGMLFGVVLQRFAGRRLSGLPGMLASLLVPAVVAAVLGVLFPVVGLWDAMSEGLLCGCGIMVTAHRIYADPRNILLTGGSIVVALLFVEMMARLFFGPPPAFPSGDGPSFLLANLLRTAAPDAAVFHVDGIPDALARSVLRADLSQPPGLVPFSERAPSAMLTAELVCSVAYGAAYEGFVDVSRERSIVFADRYVPRPSAEKRVVHIGDSMVFGVDIPRDQTFAADLEKLEPGVQHINGGISGMAPDDYLLILRSWIARHRLDRAVVYLFEGNDLNGLDAPHPCSNWESILVYTGNRAALRFASAPHNQKGIGLKWMITNSPMPYIGRVLIAEHSASAAFVGAALVALSTRGTWEPTDVQLSHLESILRSARDELNERNVEFVVVVLPHGDRLRQGMPGTFSDQVRDIARRLAVREIDATEPLVAALGRGENPFLADGTHFNVEGHRLMAQWLHEQLAAPGRVPTDGSRLRNEN